jgi:branched-subunit amino acid ABC-type transport system permease component
MSDFPTLLNVFISGLMTGLVYGLMALGLSVIFGVARVVNFAHGEMMALAMYATALLFSAFQINPFIAVVPIAVVFFSSAMRCNGWCSVPLLPALNTCSFCCFWRLPS